MHKSIIVFNFSDECAAIDAQTQSRHQKLFKSFNKCFSIYKQNGFLTQNLPILSAGIFRTHIFYAEFQDFRQEFGFFTLLMVEKVQGVVPSEKCKT